MFENVSAFLFFVGVGLGLSMIFSFIERKRRKSKTYSLPNQNLNEIYEKYYKEKIDYKSFICALNIFLERVHIDDFNRIDHKKEIAYYETRLSIAISSDVEDLLMDYIDFLPKNKEVFKIHEVILAIAKKDCNKNDSYKS